VDAYNVHPILPNLAMASELVIFPTYSEVMAGFSENSALQYKSSVFIAYILAPRTLP